MRASTLQLQDLAVERDERRLFGGISVSLNGGEALHVTGNNGAGKTTLLRILCGLTTPSVGSVLWCGQNIRDEREHYLAELFYLGHKNANKAELSCRENLIFAMGLEGTQCSDEDALGALREVGIGRMADLPVRFLSQGQQRRLAMARLLLTRAPLWILDEPYTALDVQGIAWLDRVLEQHLQRQGILVLTSHQVLSMQGRLRQLELKRQHV
jgi:heme exporter protein A